EGPAQAGGATFRPGQCGQGRRYRHQRDGRRARVAGHRLRAKGRGRSGRRHRAPLCRRRHGAARGRVHRGADAGPGCGLGRQGQARARGVMVFRLDYRGADFATAFDTLLNSKREASEEVGATVASILADVRTRGDAAVLELTERYDRFPVTRETLTFTAAEIDEAAARVPVDVRDALQLAHERITAHHEKQRPLDHVYQDALGVTLGMLWTPVEAVGIYVPGGLAAYPSSVLMNVIPARVAGASRIAMTVPTPDGEINDTVLAAAKIA